MQQSNIKSILAKLGYQTAQQIGAGLNSIVYQVDSNRVVKISSLSRIESQPLRSFLEMLANRSLPIRTPEIIESGEIDGYFYVMEKLMSGKPLREVFPTLTAKQQEKCIHNLFEALHALHSIELPSLFGELLLGENSITESSWSRFLQQKCLRVLEANRETIRADFPKIDQVAELFVSEVSSLSYPRRPSVVHGDLYFPNIMALSDGTITGIVDFSDHTLAGDPMVDRVSLAIFARPNEGQELITQNLKIRYGEEFSRFKRLYSMYYALRFSGCKASDPDTYRWCIEQYHRYLQVKFY